ncbi:hypothetical protein RAB80_000348 [Fusarium oxysporum f. sp. vasinfectum]|nr:hypothetical protein RAB80_000348 [Fusarium oxysporum f. sp. vasinfectum]
MPWVGPANSSVSSQSAPSAGRSSGERPSDPPKKSNLGTERGQGPFSGGSHWRERLFGAGAGVGVRS